MTACQAPSLRKPTPFGCRFREGELQEKNDCLPGPFFLHNLSPFVETRSPHRTVHLEHSQLF
jgi:hypothetical protein